jgi:hypothetical protein
MAYPLVSLRSHILWIQNMSMYAQYIQVFVNNPKEFLPYEMKLIFLGTKNSWNHDHCLGTTLMFLELLLFSHIPYLTFFPRNSSISYSMLTLLSYNLVYFLFSSPSIILLLSYTTLYYSLFHSTLRIFFIFPTLLYTTLFPYPPSPILILFLFFLPHLTPYTALSHPPYPSIPYLHPSTSPYLFIIF